MGTPIITQRRGKGTGPYKSPSHRYIGYISFIKIMNLADCQEDEYVLIKTANS